MTIASSDQPIVVGIDGSKHALRAAIWAADEAAHRDVPLLLTFVIAAHAKDLDEEYGKARQALHEGWLAVENTGKAVKLESTVLEGDPTEQLIEASRHAQMLCVGARGIGDSGHHDRGSTAAALAQRAYAPVAIVRRRSIDEPVLEGRWIVAALTDSPVAADVLQTAIEEAELRDAPVLALTRNSSTRAARSAHHLKRTLKEYLQEAKDDNADIQICTLPMSDHITNVLEQSAPIDQLVIVDSRDPSLVADVVGPQARAVLRHTVCSVLVLRAPRAQL
jgi:nucleotide-binding universal stress UspA family protein